MASSREGDFDTEICGFSERVDADHWEVNQMDLFTKYGKRKILPKYSKAEVLAKTVIAYLNGYAIKSFYLKVRLQDAALVKVLEQDVEAIQSENNQGTFTFSDIATPLLQFLNPNIDNPNLKSHELTQIINAVGIAMTSSYETIDGFIGKSRSKLKRMEETHDQIRVLLCFLSDIKNSTLITDYSSIYEYIGLNFNYSITGKKKVYPVTSLFEDYYDARNARILHNRIYNPLRFDVVVSNIALFEGYQSLNKLGASAYELLLLHSIEHHYYHHGLNPCQTDKAQRNFRKYVISYVKGEYSLFHGRFHVFDENWGESTERVANTFIGEKGAIDIELAGGSKFKLVFDQFGEIYASVVSNNVRSRLILRKRNRETCQKIYAVSQRRSVEQENAIFYSPILDDDIFMVKIQSDRTICVDLLTPEYIQLYDGSTFSFKEIIDNLNIALADKSNKCIKTASE